MIPLFGTVVPVLSHCGDCLNNVIHSKFGCGALLHDVIGVHAHGINAGPRVTPVVAEERYSKVLPGGMKISVWKDDLTAHQVDAVVNAANKSLSHGGGLAQALSTAGGPEIQRESKDIIRVKGVLQTGDAVVTTAGLLPCKKIIHAVGPDLPCMPSRSDVDKASPLLKKAVDNILRKVQEEKLRSVAIPAISSGLFNFPLKRCAIDIVEALKDYDERSYSKGQSLEIRLVNNDEPSVNAMKLACQEILGQESYSGAVKAYGKTSAVPPVQIGNVTLRIKTGRIEEEKTAVIVNTVGKECDLAVGEISKAIFKRAGKKIQNELMSKCSMAHYGVVIETFGYSLDCSCVYHTICERQGERRATETLKNVVLTCLKKASDNNKMSISFPAIGTGNLGFGKAEVARTMVQAVKDFANTYKRAKMDVFFVLFPTDFDTHKAFEKEVQFLENRTKNASAVSSANKGYDGVLPTSAPCIELLGGSPLQRREASRWIHEALLTPYHRHTITNNHIMHFGQREHKELLSIQTIWGVSIQEFLQDGQANVTITGTEYGVKGAMLSVEALCCQAQEDFARAEENNMLHTLVCWRCKEFPELEEPESNGALERAYRDGLDIKNVTLNGQEIQVFLKKMEAKDLTGKVCIIERKCLFGKYAMYQLPNYQRKLVDDRSSAQRIVGFRIVQIEKIVNPLLEQQFQFKKKQLSAKTQRLYQRVPAQFCELVCRVGFQRPYSPPDKPKYGAGIYFTGKPETCMDQAHFSKEEYIYIFEATVLTGKCTKGSPELIVPPPYNGNPLSLYDSVEGGIDTHVIFNSHQALPEYLITFQRD